MDHSPKRCPRPPPPAPSAPIRLHGPKIAEWGRACSPEGAPARCVPVYHEPHKARRCGGGAPPQTACLRAFRVPFSGQPCWSNSVKSSKTRKQRIRLWIMPGTLQACAVLTVIGIFCQIAAETARPGGDARTMMIVGSGKGLSRSPFGPRPMSTMCLSLRGAGEGQSVVAPKVRRRGGARGKRVRIKRAIQAGSGELRIRGDAGGREGVNIIKGSESNGVIRK